MSDDSYLFIHIDEKATIPLNILDWQAQQRALKLADREMKNQATASLHSFQNKTVEQSTLYTIQKEDREKKRLSQEQLHRYRSGFSNSSKKDKHKAAESFEGNIEPATDMNGVNVSEIISNFNQKPSEEELIVGKPVTLFSNSSSILSEPYQFSQSNLNNSNDSHVESTEASLTVEPVLSQNQVDTNLDMVLMDDNNRDISPAALEEAEKETGLKNEINNVIPMDGEMGNMVVVDIPNVANAVGAEHVQDIKSSTGNVMASPQNVMVSSISYEKLTEENPLLVDSEDWISVTPPINETYDETKEGNFCDVTGLVPSSPQTKQVTVPAVNLFDETVTADINHDKTHQNLISNCADDDAQQKTQENLGGSVSSVSVYFMFALLTYDITPAADKYLNAAASIIGPIATPTLLSLTKSDFDVGNNGSVKYLVHCCLDVPLRGASEQQVKLDVLSRLKEAVSNGSFATLANST
jgi:hypothetical protein